MSVLESNVGADIGATALSPNSDPIFPVLPGRKPGPWTCFASFRNYIAAYIVAGRLEFEGVPAIVVTVGSSYDGTSAASILVPQELLHRARWLIAWPAPSDAELTFLAIGELSTDELER